MTKFTIKDSIKLLIEIRQKFSDLDHDLVSLVNNNANYSSELCRLIALSRTHLELSFMYMKEALDVNDQVASKINKIVLQSTSSNCNHIWSGYASTFGAPATKKCLICGKIE